jgi:hypothetical protein
MPSILPIPIMVIWSPASDMRPHKVHDGAKGDKKYFVRIGSETVDANKNGVLQQLLQIRLKFLLMIEELIMLCLKTFGKERFENSCGILKAAC